MKKKRKEKLKIKKDVLAVQEAENTDQKAKGKRKQAFGKWVRLLLGVLLLLLSAWLFYKTLGVRLLFTNVLVGKICRYWLVPTIVGMILLVSGVWSVIRDIKKKDTVQLTEVKKEILPIGEFTENNEKDAAVGTTAEKKEEDLLAGEATETNEEVAPTGESTEIKEENLPPGETTESNVDSQ